MRSTLGESVGNPEIHNAPGVLTLDTTENSTRFSINNRIPAQTIVLRQVRVQFDTQGNALTQGIVYVDLPFLSSTQLTDGTNFFNLPVLLDNAVVTLKDLEIPVYLTEAIEEDFTMDVRNADGSLVNNTQLARITLQFTYDLTGN